MEYKIIYIENPPSDFEPKHFDTQAGLAGKKGKIILNNELKLSAKKINPFSLILPLLLLSIATSFSTGHFSFLFPFVVILAVIFLVLTIVFLVRSKTEKIAMRFDEIKSLNLHEYEAGFFKIRRFVINFKTNSKDIWMQSVFGKKDKDQKIYNDLKSKILH